MVTTGTGERKLMACWEKALWVLCALMAFLAGHYVAYVRYSICQL